MIYALVTSLALMAAPPAKAEAVWTARESYSSGRYGKLVVEGKFKGPANHKVKLEPVQSTNPDVLVLHVRYIPDPEPGIEVGWRKVKFTRLEYLRHVYKRVTVVNNHTMEIWRVKIEEKYED